MKFSSQFFGLEYLFSPVEAAFHADVVQENPVTAVRAFNQRRQDQFHVLRAPPPRSRF
jgi:hypothetical protein